MFVRVNPQRNRDGTVRQYLQLIEAVRVHGKPRQRVIATIGRWDRPEGRARVDAVLEALGEFSEKLTVINVQKDLKVRDGRTWGPVWVFRRLWEELGLAHLWVGLHEEVQVEFDLPEAVFAMVLHRLMDPASRKSLVEEWLPTIWEPRFASLQPHHFYRALSYVYRFTQRVEDFLFARFAELFNQNLELVLWDTVPVRSEGRGPEKRARFGDAKDKGTGGRPMGVGVLLTAHGWPLAHAVYPGHLNDVTATLSILGQLRRRFAFQKVLFVANRGALGRRTLQALEQAGFEYIVGMRIRRVRSGRDEAVGCPGRYRVVSPALCLKETVRRGRRYVLADNPEAAGRDRQILPAAAALNEVAIEADARYDGKFVVQTNTNRDAAEVARSYKTLWRVERAFRDLRSWPEIRPVYVWTDEHVRGHGVVCFLALALESYLRHKLGETVSYSQALADLEKLKAVLLQIKDRRYLLRTEPQGTAPAVFRALGIRPPDGVEELPPGRAG